MVHRIYTSSRTSAIRGYQSVESFRKTSVPSRASLHIPRRASVAHLAFELSALTLRFLDLDQSHSSNKNIFSPRKLRNSKQPDVIDRVGVDARSKPCQLHIPLASRPLPPRRPVSFLHPGAPRASHPLTRKSPIKSHHPEPL